MNINDKFDLKSFLSSSEYPISHSEKLEAILKAADQLFSEKSFDDIPTAKIAQQANVTERTLFKYFPSKKILRQRILYPLILNFFAPQQFKRVRDILCNEKLELGAVIKTLLLDRLTFVQENPGKLKFLLVELFKDDQLRSELVQLWLEHIGGPALNALKQLQSQGKIRSDLSEQAILRTIIANISVYVLSQQLFEQSIDHRKAVQEIEQIILYGVAK